MACWPIEFDIRDRNLILDPNTASLSAGYLIKTCDECGRFFFASTEHSTGFSHYRPLVFTDGACFGNGRPDARAGYGVAVGIDPIDRHKFSFQDPGVRTNQKAEIAAVKEGVRLGVEALQQEPVAACSGSNNNTFIIASDSSYTIRAITEWMPGWRANGFRNIQNRDAFKRLDDTISYYESLGYRIGFWHVRRQFNSHANELAGQGAHMDQGAPTQAPPRSLGYQGDVFTAYGYPGYQ